MVFTDCTVDNYSDLKIDCEYSEVYVWVGIPLVTFDLEHRYFFDSLGHLYQAGFPKCCRHHFSLLVVVLTVGVLCNHRVWNEACVLQARLYALSVELRLIHVEVIKEIRLVN